MYPVVEAYLSSDQTQDSFCSEAGISVAVLNYWLKKYRSEPGRTASVVCSGYAPTSSGGQPAWK